MIVSPVPGIVSIFLDFMYALGFGVNFSIVKANYAWKIDMSIVKRFAIFIIGVNVKRVSSDLKISKIF